MGFLNFLRKPDIDQGVKNFRADPGAVLLDVRTPGEYREVRIPGSKNVPLQQLDSVMDLAQYRDIPLYVYCRSGSRSAQAVRRLQDMGYTNVQNIGGIAAYSGAVER